jgi:hypothetical protein
MFPLYDWSSPLAEQTSEGLNDAPTTHVSEEQRVHALETEVNALQGLVCYLLEKNEYLRMRLPMS